MCHEGGDGGGGEEGEGEEGEGGTVGILVSVELDEFHDGIFGVADVGLNGEVCVGDWTGGCSFGDGYGFVECLFVVGVWG